MPKVNYTATIDIARPTVWDFVRDMNNWAPFAKGYQSHEVVNDQESVWIIKGDVGPISRTTKFQIQITEWLEGELVAFVLKGLNEPITGEGAIRLTDTDAGRGTDIRGDATLEFGGSLGPVVNHLIGPWVRAGADELVTKIATALQPSYRRPARPMFVVRWLLGVWRLLRRAASAAYRVARGGAAPAAGTGTAETPVATADRAAQAKGQRVPLRLEAVLLSLDADRYAGKVEGMIGVGGIATAARRIEELGFDGATSPEAGHDPFLPLVIAAEHTQNISLATNVAIAFPRSPLVTAQMAWDLQRLSGGRFQLGLGTQVKGHNERRYSTPWTAPPGPRLRDYVLCLKAMFETFQNGGSPSFFTGEHYQFSLMPPVFNPGPIEHPHVPIYIAAVNKYMARLAGELCDGLRLHPIATFTYTREVVLPAIEAGARRAGRQLSDVDVVGAPFIATGRDEEELAAAKRDVKQRIAFYASTRTYHSPLEYHGWGEVGQKLHELSLEGKWQEMTDLISDEMLDEFAVIATYDELASRLKERCRGVFSTATLDLPPRLREDEARLREIVQALRQD